MKVHSMIFLVLAITLTGCSSSNVELPEQVEITTLLSSPLSYNGLKVCTKGFTFAAYGKTSHIIANVERNRRAVESILEPDLNLEKYEEAVEIGLCGVIDLNEDCFDLDNTENPELCIPSTVDLKDSYLSSGN